MDKKLIKKIKKQVVNQFETDIKDAILKELYGSASKKELKKLRKQILREVQEELFGSVDKPKKTKKSKKNKSPKNEVETVEAPIKEEVIEKSTHEYKGFEFDVKKMSEMVTGQKRPNVPYVPQEGETAKDVADSIERKKTKKETPDKSDFKKIDLGMPKPSEETMPKDKKDMLRDILKHSKSINSTINQPSFNTPSPTTITTIKGRNYGLKTPAQKEELIFFIGKLKEGVSKLSKGEKNINYRLRKDDRYIFSYNREKSQNNEFSLRFSIELNVKTGAAKIEDFNFQMENFTFDASFFDVLDVVKVLDRVGFNINQYVSEINEVSGKYAKSTSPDSVYSGLIDVEKIKQPTIKPKKSLSKNVRLSTIIDDNRLLNLLNRNDVVTYGDYTRVEDLTVLKGIGTKTAEKISDIVDRYVENYIV